MELSKTKFNLYCSLGTTKMRRRHGLFTVEGEKSVADSLASFNVEAVICVRGFKPSADMSRHPLYEVSAGEMRRLSNLSTPSDVMAVYRLPGVVDDKPVAVPPDLYVVLDGIQDPGNLGTIVRTCHWFGLRHIFASLDTVDIYNPKTIQSTMGSLGHVDVTYCNLSELFEANPQLPVYGTLLEGRNIFREKLGKTGFIVMGNEGNGISEGLRSRITNPLTIPPGSQDHSESLNVAIATAITISCFIR